MIHEKIIQRENGDRVKIVVQFGVAWITDEFGWSTFHYHCPKGKRKFVPSNEATKEEILSAKLELWEKIKPV